jgi:hypothetical protein
MVVTSKESDSKINHMEAARDFNGNIPNLQVFNLVEIEAATGRLSIENKLGEGGYGPVYKVNFSYTANIVALPHHHYKCFKFTTKQICRNVTLIYEMLHFGSRSRKCLAVS